MQYGRFLVLTGHLNDYPLSDLVGILRHQHKTGRLLIEYPNSPASFFFYEGELVDAQLGYLSGLQAICVALAQPASSFNFNPLIRPTRRSIDDSLQHVVSELLGCWGENEIEVERIAPGQLPQPALLPATSTPPGGTAGTGLDGAPTILALPPGTENRFSRPILGMAAVGLLLLGLSTVIAVTGAFGKRGLSVGVPSPASQVSGESAASISNDAPLQKLAKTEFPNSRVQRPIAKEKGAAPDLDRSSRQETRSQLVSKKVMEDSEATGAMSPEAKPDARPQQEQNAAPAESHSVKVLLQVEGGRVAQASVANHQSGMEAYEGLALRIARQRRYPSKGAQLEVVTIKVSLPK